MYVVILDLTLFFLVRFALLVYLCIELCCVVVMLFDCTVWLYLCFVGCFWYQVVLVVGVDMLYVAFGDICIVLLSFNYKCVCIDISNFR